MKDRVKAGAMTKEQMALVRFMKDKVEVKETRGIPLSPLRVALEWQGNYGLLRRGF
jgi:hypothetical protein